MRDETEETMKAPSHADAFEVLCLQAADDGRGEVLFGSSLPRARAAGRSFMVGKGFPNVYLEFPLAGDPFLDVTILYNDAGPDVHIESPAVEDADALFNWFEPVFAHNNNVTFGFELDTKNEPIGAAGVHFQPRRNSELVEPFFQAIGEPERAQLYLDLEKRMPEGWPLSFFGLFRGRPGSPLRVCGYLDTNEHRTCAEDRQHLAAVFDEIGFTAYDEAMLEQITTLMNATSGSIDFQFDVYPDGKLGDIFAIDLQFEIEQPEAVLTSFTSGRGARIMGLLESWGAADKRWKLGAEAAFARSIPVEQEDGTYGNYAFTLMPQWVKARWRNTVLQNAKLYHLGMAGIPEKRDS